MTTTFAQLGVSENICRALEQRGITDAFEIQAATIADALAGKDVCGRAPTGSGKTLAFGVPLIETVERADKRNPKALILAPTRELADQITTELRSFAGSVRVAAVYGGVGYGPQLKALRDGVDVLVACPGRLEDLIERGAVSLHAVNKVVLDEADRMADMGFMPAVKRLLDKTSSKRQTVLFSATLDGDIAKLSRDYQTNPVRHEVGDSTPDITSASHVFWNVAGTDRIQVTTEAVNAVWPAIIFSRTRHGADRIAKQLERNGVSAAAIHGGRNQGQRTRALAAFSKGKVEALVATDVAARGIHVDGVALVVHYDPPADHKDYVHRSGRTARAGEGGVVVSMVQRDQVKDLTKMQRKIGLNEPFTAPDVAAMRELSPGPTRQKPARTSSYNDAVADDRSSTARPSRHARPSRPSGSRSEGKPKSRSSRPGSKNSSSRGSSAGGSSDGSRSNSDSRSNSNGRSNSDSRSNSNGRSSSDGRSTSDGRSSSGRSSSGRSANAQANNANSKRDNRKSRRAHLQP